MNEGFKDWFKSSQPPKMCILTVMINDREIIPALQKFLKGKRGRLEYMERGIKTYLQGSDMPRFILQTDNHTADRVQTEIESKFKTDIDWRKIFVNVSC